MENNFLDKMVTIKWVDSYIVEAGWRDISEFDPELCVISSWGKVIYENANLLALAHNYAEATNHTLLQANGIMVIPKVCITEITKI